MKFFYNTLGVLAVLLGILGIFLPLLPTTPFLLLASACFARGSVRLHRWLIGHRVFGKYIANFEAGHGIPLKGKIVATVMLWGSMAWSSRHFDSIAILIVMGVIGACVSTYMWWYLPTLKLPRESVAPAAHAAPAAPAASAAPAAPADHIVSRTELP